MTDLQEVTLETLAGGAAGELFEREWKRVLENIQDPNTDAKAKRKVTLTFVVMPDAKREGGEVLIGSNASVAPVRPAASKIYFGTRDGAQTAFGFDPKQADLFRHTDPSVQPISRAAPAQGAQG